MAKGTLLKNDFGLTEERSFYYWGPIVKTSPGENWLMRTINKEHGRQGKYNFKKIALSHVTIESYFEALLSYAYDDKFNNKWATDSVIVEVKNYLSRKEIVNKLRIMKLELNGGHVRRLDFTYLTPSAINDTYIELFKYYEIIDINLEQGYFLAKTNNEIKKLYINQIIGIADEFSSYLRSWGKFTFTPEKGNTRMIYKEEHIPKHLSPWDTSKRRKLMPDPTHVEEMRKELINESPSFLPLKKLTEFKAIKRVHRPIANKVVKTQASSSANASSNVYHELAPVLEKMVKDTLKIDPTWNLQLMSPEGKRYSLKLEELED